MAKALKADCSVVNASYVQKELGASLPEVWITAAVGFEAAALTAWEPGFSGDFVDVLIAGVLNDGVYIYKAADFVWSIESDGDSSFVPTAGAWHTVELHYLNGTVTEAFIDGLTGPTSTPGAFDITAVLCGQLFSNQQVAGNIAYIGSFRAGTTRGGSGLFADDFEDGTLDAWDATTGGVSVVDSPAFSGDESAPLEPEVPADPVGVCIAFDDATLTAAPIWTRIDDPDGYRLVSDWSIRRGRSSELDKTATGTATINAIDTTGDLDPTNGSSPFVGNLDPMKQGAIALFNPVAETWHTIFRGFADWSYEIDASGKFTATTIELTDAFDLFAALEMTPGHQGDTAPAGSEGDIYFSETAGPTPGPFTRIHQILDDIGWASALRKILTGNIQLQGSRYARRDQALAAIFDTADAEFPGVANFYIDKIGRPTFHGRYARFEPEDPDYEIEFWQVGTAAYAEADPDVVPLSALGFRRSKDDIINAALITPQIPGGGEFTTAEIASMFVKDDSSIGTYGWRSISFTDLLLLSARAFVGEPFDITAVDEVQKYAHYYVDNYKTPHTRVTRIVFRPLAKEHPNAAALWELMCRVEIGDVITLTTDHPGGGGFDEDFFVEGISYDAAPMKKDIPEVTLTLDVSPRAFYGDNPFGPSDGG